MPAFVALFRAVNVGGRATVAMRDLVATATRLGLEAPRTLLQSGNLVFSCDRTEPATVATALETAVRDDLALVTRVIVVSAPAWAEIVAACPFPDVARADPSHLVVMPLCASPSSEAEKALRDAIVAREAVALRGATAYIHYPDGIGRSKLTAAVIERRLGTVGTGRNWNTVLKIAAMLSA